MASLLTPEVKNWIGYQVSYTAPEELGYSSIRYYAMALGDHNPLYKNKEYAEGTRYKGIIAPPTLISDSNQYMDAKPDDSGYTGHLWNLPIPDSNILRGGNDYEFFQTVRPTDRITVTWTIADIYERDTRRGPMLFVISEITYSNQDKNLLAKNKETTIYQPR